jgi:hypothetical protein
METNSNLYAPPETPCRLFKGSPLRRGQTRLGNRGPPLDKGALPWYPGLMTDKEHQWQATRGSRGADRGTQTFSPMLINIAPGRVVKTSYPGGPALKLLYLVLAGEEWNPSDTSDMAGVSAVEA